MPGAIWRVHNFHRSESLQQQTFIRSPTVHYCFNNMEALLSLAFDNLSSSSTDKVRKGLRQIEGLLAQITLSKTTKLAASPSKRRSPAVTPTTNTTVQTGARELSALKEDPAFREFFKLQEGFEWNGPYR